MDSRVANVRTAKGEQGMLFGHKGDVHRIIGCAHTNGAQAIKTKIYEKERLSKVYHGARPLRLTELLQ